MKDYQDIPLSPEEMCNIWKEIRQQLRGKKGDVDD